jgi:hypothetical protein
VVFVNKIAGRKMTAVVIAPTVKVAAVINAPSDIGSAIYIEIY